MNQVIKISLISKSHTLNSIGVTVTTETKTDVFAQAYSVTQAEFFKAGQEGLKPQGIYAVRSMEYAGQDEIEVNSERFTVYRTFVRVDGRTELYVSRRKGSNDIITT